MIHHTSSATETQQLAKDLAAKYKQTGGVIALMGELGAGKTTFSQGFAVELGIDQRIISPTFVIMRQYPIPDSEKLFYHIDLYRLEKDFNLEETGLKEILESDNIVLIEWAEKLGDELLEKIVKVKFKRVDETKREIEIAE